MSFNFLPDELIAQVSSHLDYKDILSLLETQKRINRILKHYEMDKPVVQELRVAHNSRLVVTRKLRNENHSREVKLPSEEGNNIAICLAKFRSVDILRILDVSLNDDDVCSILKYKGKIKKGAIVRTKLCFSPENFVPLCKKYSFIHFAACECYEQYLNDNLLGPIMASTKVEIDNISRQKERIVFNFSDKFLDDILTGIHSEQIVLAGADTSFTVRGIWRFVEECMHRGNMIMYIMGILNKDQRADARAWYEYLKEQPELGYRVGEHDRPRLGYSIIHHSPICSLSFEIADNV